MKQERPGVGRVRSVCTGDGPNLDLGYPVGKRLPGEGPVPGPGEGSRGDDQCVLTENLPILQDLADQVSSTVGLCRQGPIAHAVRMLDQHRSGPSHPECVLRLSADRREMQQAPANPEVLAM